MEDSGEVSDVADAADPIKHTLIMDLKQGVAWLTAFRLLILGKS